MQNLKIYNIYLERKNMTVSPELKRFAIIVSFILLGLVIAALVGLFFLVQYLMLDEATPVKVLEQNQSKMIEYKTGTIQSH